MTKLYAVAGEAFTKKKLATIDAEIRQAERALAILVARRARLERLYLSPDEAARRRLKRAGEKLDW